MLENVPVPGLRHGGRAAQERAAAATVTNVPRSLAAALAPLLAGALLQKTIFDWPPVIGEELKDTYDLALLIQFRVTKSPT